MTREEREEFKNLIKEGSLEALGSKEGQSAIVGALNSEEGREAIKQGSLEAFKSEEGKDLFIDYFVEAFHDVVVPVFETYDKKIKHIQQEKSL